MVNERPWFIRYKTSIAEQIGIDKLKEMGEKQSGVKTTVVQSEDDVKVIFDATKPIEKEEQ